jgi:hypothetical protein
MENSLKRSNKSNKIMIKNNKYMNKKLIRNKQSNLKQPRRSKNRLNNKIQGRKKKSLK